MQGANNTNGIRLQHGKISQIGPPSDYVPRKTRVVKVLSSLSDNFASDDLVTITLPPANNPDGSTQCVMYGDTLRKIAAIPEFPERRVKPTQDVIEARKSSGRGLGVFATADIQVGQLLVSERPLLFTPTILATYPESLSRAEYSTEELMQIQLYEWEKDLEVAISMMPAKSRNKYFKLANSHTEDGSGLIVGISRTNTYGTNVKCLHLSGVTFPQAAIGDVVSRINHSCCPNASVHFHIPSFSLELRAVRAIAAGENISIAYCDITKPFEQRKAALAPYGFACACAACSDPAKSDVIRAACRGTPTPPSDGNVDPALAVRAIRALRNAGLQATNQYAYYHVVALKGFIKRENLEKGRKYLRLSAALEAAVNGRPHPEIISSAIPKTASSDNLPPGLEHLRNLRISNPTST